MTMVLEKKNFNAATCRQNDHMAHIYRLNYIEVEDVKMSTKKRMKEKQKR